MALIANREARYYTCAHNRIVGKDAHGNARIVPVKMILKPGVNDVKDATWLLVRTNAGLQRRLRSGMLEVLEEPELDNEGEVLIKDDLADATPTERIAASLGEMTIKSAKPLIRETVDVATLEAWYEADERKGIRDAIELQLVKVTKKSTDKD